MFLDQQYEHTFSFWWHTMLAFPVIMLMVSCAGVKNAPKNIPFAFENRIEVKSNELGNEERRLLTDKMLGYLDDSLMVRTISVLGRTRRINPPVFDSANVLRSIRYMNGYLNSIGYYHANFDSFTVKTEERPERSEIRVTTTFFVTLGKSMRVDTLVYQFSNPVLQQLADSVKPQSGLLKNAMYSKDKVATELDRLSGTFRARGFLKMSRSALLAEADTTDPALVDLDVDPVGQIISAQRRINSPRIGLTIFQRPNIESSVFQQYYIDSVIIYPEARITDDLNRLMTDTSLHVFEGRPGILIKSRDNLFTSKMLRRSNYMLPGQLYDDAWYYKTVNSYSQMGPWEQVDSRVNTRFDSVNLASFHLFLFPAKKQSFQVDFEGSQNNNISVSNVLAGRFLALSVNASHRNRNLFRKGTQSTTAASFGLEVNNTRSATNPNFFQTFIVSLSQSYSLPRLIKPFHFLDTRRGIDAGRTNINLTGLYTERFRFFTQTSVNTNLQWEWRKGRNTASISLPNIESVFLQQFQDSLDKVIAQNPSLQFAFTPGNILSVRAAIERGIRFKKANHTGLVRIVSELALKPGFRLFNNDFFSFYRIETQYIEGVKFQRTSVHYRLYGGVGWDLSGKTNATMPFFRQFVAGGNNSMRAWRLRQLGLGSSLASDTSTFPDRFGDIQLEANFEYRFRLFRIFGYNMEGVAFSDVGNIWNHNNHADGSGSLQLRNLYLDLAMAVGTGIRWDLSYLVIRLDAGFKVKDPVREGAGWLRTFEWKSSNRMGGPARSNLGVQFGIGYPF